MDDFSDPAPADAPTGSFHSLLDIRDSVPADAPTGCFHDTTGTSDPVPADAPTGSFAFLFDIRDPDPADAPAGSFHDVVGNSDPVSVDALTGKFYNMVEKFSMGCSEDDLKDGLSCAPRSFGMQVRLRMHDKHNTNACDATCRPSFFHCISILA